MNKEASMMTGTEPRSFARAAGVVYLGYFAAAIFGSVLVSRKMNAGVAVTCLADVLYAVTSLLFYRLFRPVSGILALVATVFSLSGCAADILDQINRAPAGLSPLLFFGPFCVLLGLLILRSEFLPRWLGWPLIVAGVGWLAFLIPAVATHARVVIFPLGFLAELVLMLWLLIKGVNEARWAAVRSLHSIRINK
jgi:hypothetical protein